MLKKKNLGRKFLERVLILGGLLLLLVPLFFKRIPRKISPEPENLSPSEESATISGSLPLRIIIPKVGIDSLVKEAKVEGNNWELFEDAASYLSTSAKIGEQGNTVIYAHAKPHLFGPIKKVKKGERIYILTDSDWAVYEVFKTETVSPTKLEVVFPTEEKTLTLYTCTNFLDKDRFVVFAKTYIYTLEVERY